MRVLILIAAVLVAGAIAQDDPTIAPFVCDGNAFVCKMKELGHHIKFHATNLGGKLLDVGSSVLSAAADQGKNLLVSGSQAVLGTVLEHLNKSGLVGKRDIEFIDEMGEFVKRGFGFIQKIKDALQEKFGNAVQKITDVVKNTASLKDVAEDAEQKVDDAVAEFKTTGASKFRELAAGIRDRLTAVFGKGIERLREIFGKDDEKRQLAAGLSGAFAKAKEIFGGVVGGIADTFKPHWEALKTGVQSLADKAKEHAGNLVDAAKGHFNTLKDKLSDHVEALKGHASTLGGHATNALNALKEAVASVVSQTAGNIKDTVGDIVNTGKDAAGTIKDHFAGSN